MMECMQTCQKMQNARSPKLENVDEMFVFLKKIAEIVYQPGTQTLFPNALGSSVWSSLSDAEEEGHWMDWYSKTEIDLLQGLSGEVGMY